MYKNKVGKIEKDKDFGIFDSGYMTFTDYVSTSLNKSEA